MRRFPLALAGATLLAAGIGLHAANGSTPASSTLTVPSAPGKSAHVHYTGTIPPGANAAGDCSAEPSNLSDAHTVKIVAPAGGYSNVKAVFAFAIDWTATGLPESDDQMVTLLAPDGSTIGTADNSAPGGPPGEALTVNNLPSGTYTVLACGFTNIAPKDYTGDVVVHTFAVPKAGKVSADVHTVNDKTLTFTPSTIVDPILFGGEPGITFDPTTDGTREFADWPVSSRTNIGAFYRSTDGGLSFQKRYADINDGDQKDLACSGRQVPYCPTGGGGDTDTQVDPATGNVYFSSQESLANEASGTSFDHGTTFPSDHADPVTQKVGGDVDRQWLGYWKGTQTVFLAYHSPIVGAYVVRSDQAGKTGTWTVPGTPQIPYVAQTGAMEVDNTGGLHNHTIYLAYLSSKPNSSTILDESPHIAVSTDGAATFTSYKMPNLKDADGTEHSVHNFIKIYLDNAGNIYEVWSDSTTNATYLATSKATAPGNIAHPGSVWKGPYLISASPADVTIFPDVRAGSPGRIAAIYYGTHASAATPDDVKPGDGGWYPYVSYSSNALCMWDAHPCTSPTFHQTTVTSKMNQDDNICTSGTACAATMGNRSLADYWDIDIDRNGHLGFIWSDTTNDIGGPFVRVARQMTGPSLYAGRPNASLPHRGNGYPDAAGDAIFPFAGAQVLHSPNHPTLDLRGTSVAVKGSNLEFTIKLASAANLGAKVPTGLDGATPLQQAKYVVRWDFGKAAYYVGANVPAGGSPSYFSGKVSTNEGVLSPTNPDALFAFGNTYAPLGPATGKVVGNSLVIDVPASAVGGAKAGSHLVSVGSYAMVGPQDRLVVLETLPITVDATPTFDTKLAAAPGSASSPSTPGTPGGGSGNGSNGSNGGSLATTGGSDALAVVGALLLMGAALIGRRRRTA